MAYTKKIWKDYPDTTTPIKVEDLNNIENGLEAVDAAANSGWVPLTETFTYVSATTMRASGDYRTKYFKGMKIKLTQSSTIKYFVIAITPTYSGGYTTLTVHPFDSTTSLANATISDVYFSTAERPSGFPAKPMARAYLGSNQENLITNTYTKILLDSVDYDIGSNFSSYKFTVPCTGYYKVNCSVMFVSVIADKLYIGQFRVNDTSVCDDYKHSALAQSLQVKPSSTLYLNKGDYIELFGVSFAGVDTVDVIKGSKYTFLEVEFVCN